MPDNQEQSSTIKQTAVALVGMMISFRGGFSARLFTRNAPPTIYVSLMAFKKP